MAELVYQLLACGADNECSNYIKISDIGKLGALLGEVLDELAGGLFRLLSIAPKVPRVTGVHVCALKVPHEDFNEVALVVDQSHGKVLSPGCGRFS